MEKFFEIKKEDSVNLLVDTIKNKKIKMVLSNSGEKNNQDFDNSYSNMDAWSKRLPLFDK